MKTAVIVFTFAVLFSSSFTMNSDFFMIDEAYAQADAAKQAQEKGKEAAQAAKESAQEKSQQKSETKSQQEQSNSQASSAQQGSQQQAPAQKEQTEKQTPPTQRQETPEQRQEVPTQRQDVQQERPVEKIPKQESSDERHIVVLNEGVSPRELAQSHGLIPAFVYSKALNGLAGKIPADVLEKLRQDPRVKFVEKDQTSFAFAQTIPTGIDRINAELSIAKIDGVDERVNADIAVIDTGVSSHSDLNVVATVDCTNDLNPCSRGGGDSFGHGTHVAGTAAALDNSQGVVGVAPGANIWSVKVLGDDGSGWISWLIAGIDYVTANAGTIDAANLSLGCECKSAALDDAISKSVSSGVVYVVAAGNEAKDVSSFSPASHPDVITVSAIADFDGKPGSNAASTCISDRDDTFAFFSNYGSGVEITAPGTCILSTWNDGGYGVLSGTSMAAPHVTGTVALYLSENSKPQSSSDVRDVRQKIIEMAFDASSSDGYSSSDDPDGIAEPLVNAGALELTEERQQETIEEQPLEEPEQEEEPATEPEEDSEIVEKVKNRGLEIAEKMRGIGKSQDAKQRSMAIIQKLTEKDLEEDTQTADVAAKISSLEDEPLIGLNIAKEPEKREVFAKAKSEVIVETISENTETEKRVKDLITKLEQGKYYGPSLDQEPESFDLVIDGSARNQNQRVDFAGEIFLESLYRGEVSKLKVTGGELIVGDSIFDVAFGKARVLTSDAGSRMIIVSQVTDLDDNVFSLKLLLEIENLASESSVKVGPSQIAGNWRLDGVGQLSKIS